MKLQILYLEHFDDRVSAGEKLNWVRADRVLMVWPARGEVMTSKLDLRLLQRQASALRVQLGLVSHDPAVRRHARDLGMPVFDDLENLPDQRWLKANAPARPALEQVEPAHIRRERLETRRRREDTDSGLSARGHRTMFGVALGALLIMAAAILPSAQVIVAPETRSIELAWEFPLDPAEADDQTGNRPFMDERTVVVSGTHRVATIAARTSPSTNRGPTVSSADLSAVESELRDALLDQAAEMLDGQLGPSERLLQGSLKVERVLRHEFDSAPGEIAATVALELEVEIRGLVVEDADLVDFVLRNLEPQIHADWEAVPDSLTYEVAEFNRRGDAYLELSASLLSFRPRETAFVPVRIAGLELEQAREQIRRTLDVRDVTFKLTPSWMPWLPFVPARIGVVYPWEPG